MKAGVLFRSSIVTDINLFAANRLSIKAGPQGFEPRFIDPESIVLPLHQGPKVLLFYHKGTIIHKLFVYLNTQFIKSHLLEDADRILESFYYFLFADNLHALEQRRADRSPGDGDTQDAE